jgi:hypothetical protein
VLFEGDDRAIKGDALIMVAHDGGGSPLPDRFDYLVRPRCKVNQIAEAEYRVRPLFIDVLQHCM